MTTEQITLLRELHGQNLPISVICERMNFSKSHITHTISGLGISKNAAHITHNSKIRDQIVPLYLSGATVGQIAARLSTSRWTVSEEIKRANIVRVTEEKPKPTKEALERNLRQRIINKNNPIGRLLTRAKYRAKKKNLNFNLTRSDISIPKLCPVLGIPLALNDGRQRDNSVSLDRIVPELGYIRGNVRVISWRANSLKNNGSVEEFTNVLRFLETRSPVFESAPQSYNKQFVEEMICHRRYCAQKKNIVFDLIPSDIFIPEVCPVLGIPLRRGVGKSSAAANLNNPSLDRFTPSEGYIKENVCVISWRANKLKNNASIEEIRLILNDMKAYQQSSL